MAASRPDRGKKMLFKSRRSWAFALTLTATVALGAFGTHAWGDDPPHNAAAKESKEGKDKAPAKGDFFKPEEKLSTGTVTTASGRVEYQAVAGTLVVHPKGWDDVPRPDDQGADDDKNPRAEASMFYVAYFKQGAKPGSRPITFLYNGGPGSSTVWLHMGAFGPRRVVTADDSHTPAAPYSVVNNESSLLDASDLVFIDAPGAGFSRIAGPDKEKAFWGVDADGRAFAQFITQFLSKYGRWNSPKYLFGESYGTTRSAVVANLLETEHSVDLNGVILLSQILNFDLNGDAPQFNPGVDLPYQLLLPTFAATAWYHHKLPDAASLPKDLPTFLKGVEQFAMGEYAQALQAGATLPDATRDAVAARLHQYTGLPVDYIKKSNLRINGGQFEKELQADSDTTTGRLDARFSGPSLDPLSREAGYDPQSAAISSAYVAAFNDYARKDLKYGEGVAYRPEVEVFTDWSFTHQPPGVPVALPQAPNVMTDLAAAMIYNPNLKVMLNTGYYDLATPFYEGVYEMSHLPVPARLQSNIQYKFYESGHMVYANQASLKALHDNVAAFIRATQNSTDK